MEKIVGVDQLYFMPQPLLEIVQRLMAHPVYFNYIQLLIVHFVHRFSKLFSFYALHWVKDQKMVLNNSYQLLQKGINVSFLQKLNLPSCDMNHVIFNNFLEYKSCINFWLHSVYNKVFFA